MFNSYGITEYDGKTIILLLAPYTPFEKAGAEYLPLDACYPCVHAAHKETKRLIAKLNAEGIEAQEFTEPVYTKLAFQAGLAYAKGRNSLAYNEKFGSRFVLCAISLPTPLDVAGTGVLTAQGQVDGCQHPRPRDIERPKCNPNCHMCIRACPAGAISESGLTANKCLRWHMRTGEYPSDEIARKAGGAFFGCDICQRVCPMNNAQNNAQRITHNAQLKDNTIPPELKKLLLIKDFLKTPKEHTEALGEYIGVNYANVNRLLALCINAAGNGGNKEYAPLIEPYLESGSQTVKTAAQRALRNLNK